MHRSVRRAICAALSLSLALGAILLLPATPAAAATCKAGTPSDFNGDGHADIAAADAGSADRIHIIYGTSHGLTADKSGTALDDQILNDPNAPSDFGIAMATGDFNGDGCADLAVGDTAISFTNAVSAGAVDIYFGSPTGLTFAHQLTAHSIGLSLQAHSGFGDGLAAGNFNGDKVSDLVIGAFNEFDGVTTSGTGAGAIYIVPGSKAGTFTGGKRFQQGDGIVPGTAEVGDRFGLTLTTGDFNGDGTSDVAIGAPGENNGSGAVDVIRGSGTSSLLTATGAKGWTQDSTGVPGTAEDFDGFGAALATGDFNGDSKADLAVGVPGEDVGTVVDGGTVDVIYGSGSGLTGSGAQAWTQDSTGVPGSVEANDSFGYALAAGDFNGGGKTDLAIGSPGEGIGDVTGAGSVTVLPGASGSGLTGTGSSSWDQNTPGISGESEQNDGFGSTLYAARIRSASRYDLLISTPNEELNDIQGDGVMQVLPGSSGGVTATGSQIFDDGTAGIMGSSCQTCNFGYSLS